MVHYRNLKFYVNNGIKITKFHQAVKFRQSKWLSIYIALNTQKRQEASTKFDQDFYKLLSNSTFGKFCESLRNRVTVSFTRSEEELLKATSEGKVSLIKIIDENLALIAKKKQSIQWNKPTIAGAGILELSKLFMLAFHYNVMKNKPIVCCCIQIQTLSFTSLKAEFIMTTWKNFSISKSFRPLKFSNRSQTLR